MALYDDEEFFNNYAGMPRSRFGLSAAGEWGQLSALLPEDFMGLDVLDLGCGYGWHSKYAAERGARSVLGLDPSERMLAAARERNPHPAVEYRLCSAEGYGWPPESFDLVVSNLALHYVEDLGGVYAGVFRTLRPGGAFVMNIEHPAFTSGVNEDWLYDSGGRAVCWPMDGYFLPGPRETLFAGCEVIKYHHTLAQILGGLLEAGFTLAAVDEARPDGEMLKLPGMADELRRPQMLLVRAEKRI